MIKEYFKTVFLPIFGIGIVASFWIGIIAIWCVLGALAVTTIVGLILG